MPLIVLHRIDDLEKSQQDRPIGPLVLHRIDDLETIDYSCFTKN